MIKYTTVISVISFSVRCVTSFVVIGSREFSSVLILGLIKSSWRRAVSRRVETTLRKFATHALLHANSITLFFVEATTPPSSSDTVFC